MSQSKSWRPTSTRELMQQRAELICKVRDYFHSQDVLEVETPILSQAGVTDYHLQSLTCRSTLPETAHQETLYLQTSPEYAMKRLLCAGFGDIYQISKAFRQDESGRIHNPEFTMLEWYRLDFDHHQLMDDMDKFLQFVAHTKPSIRISYQQIFLDYLYLDPLVCSLSDLKVSAMLHGFAEISEDEQDRDTLLQLLFSFVIEPQLGHQQPIFVYDFPASQAALARINTFDDRVASRFEVYYQGVELANGFHELADVAEQRHRFEQDNHKRRQNNVATVPIDERFLSALEHGLPNCAGVALGIDRLFMLKQGLSEIQEAMCFPLSNA